MHTFGVHRLGYYRLTRLGQYEFDLGVGLKQNISSYVVGNEANIISGKLYVITASLRKPESGYLTNGIGITSKSHKSHAKTQGKDSRKSTKHILLNAQKPPMLLRIRRNSSILKIRQKRWFQLNGQGVDLADRKISEMATVFLFDVLVALRACQPLTSVFPAIPS